MPALAGRCELVVEAHGDIADEETTNVCHFQTTWRAADEAVGFEVAEGGKFLREMFGEVDAELRKRQASCI